MNYILQTNKMREYESMQTEIKIVNLQERKLMR